MLQGTRDDEFAAAYAAHRTEALRVARLLSGDPDRAEEAVADAFVKIYRRWGSGGIQHPRAYIRRAVANEVSSRFRRLALERREATRRWGDDRGTRSAEAHVVDRDELLTALQQLPERQRTAVVLRYYGDLPAAEVATAMGVSVGTVKSAIHRGLGTLRELLEAPQGATPPGLRGTPSSAAVTGRPLSTAVTRRTARPTRAGDHGGDQPRPDHGIALHRHRGHVGARPLGGGVTLVALEGAGRVRSQDRRGDEGLQQRPPRGPTPARVGEVVGPSTSS